MRMEEKKVTSLLYNATCFTVSVIVVLCQVLVRRDYVVANMFLIRLLVAFHLFSLHDGFSSLVFPLQRTTRRCCLFMPGSAR